MLDLNIVWGVALTAMVLACPLMMFGMMAMAALPITRRWFGQRGGGHMMCHGIMSQGSEPENQPAIRSLDQHGTDM